MLVPNLHFSRKLRGRQVDDDDTKVFEGSMMEQLEDVDSVPKKLTTKIIFIISSMFRKFRKKCQSSRMPMKILDTSLKFQMFLATENGQSCIFLVHRKVSQHSGYENSFRVSLNLLELCREEGKVELKVEMYKECDGIPELIKMYRWYNPKDELKIAYSDSRLGFEIECD